MALGFLSGCTQPSLSTGEQDVIQINLYCTTCDDFLQCRSEGDVDYTLYRLQPKSFWAQIATIWDYLIAQVRPKTSDHRPLTIYEDINGQKRLRLEDAEARVDLRTATIGLPDSSIDMRDGRWQASNGRVLGQCEAMTRRDGYAFVREWIGKAPL